MLEKAQVSCLHTEHRFRYQFRLLQGCCRCFHQRCPCLHCPCLRCRHYHQRLPSCKFWLRRQSQERRLWQAKSHSGCLVLRQPDRRVKASCFPERGHWSSAQKKQWPGSKLMVCWIARPGFPIVELFIENSG